MTHSTLPKNPRALLNNLEVIKRVIDEKHSASLKAKAKEASAASGTAKGNSKKRSASGSSGELQVPKKARPSKFCQHCKAKGGPHLTHTKECRSNNGNGNSISLFQTQPANAKKPAKKGGNQQMAYLTATIESLVKKGLKKAMKGKKRKRNRANDSSSSDSDSEQEIGSRDTGLVVDKCLKLDKPFMSDLQSTQPRLIKVTDSVSDSKRANVKALENAKMEKVTKVVAVMHIYGNANSSSINANAKISAKKTQLESKSKKLGLN